MTQHYEYTTAHGRLRNLDFDSYSANGWRLHSFTTVSDGDGPYSIAVWERQVTNQTPFIEWQPQDLETIKHQRGLLGQALGELLYALRAVNQVEMTGPELVMHAEDVTRVIRKDGWAVLPEER